MNKKIQIPPPIEAKPLTIVIWFLINLLFLGSLVIGVVFDIAELRNSCFSLIYLSSVLACLYAYFIYKPVLLGRYINAMQMKPLSDNKYIKFADWGLDICIVFFLLFTGYYIQAVLFAFANAVHQYVYYRILESKTLK